MSLPRALPAARVLTALELARTGLSLDVVGPSGVLDAFLLELGVPALVGDELRLDLAVTLVELAEQYDRLEQGGTAELDDDLPAGVNRSRARDAELERLYGEVTDVVRRLAGALT